MVGFDKAIYDVFSLLFDAQVFFLSIASTLATICFVLSFGIDSIKVAFGGENLSKMFMKNFMGLVTYFLLIWLFPIGLPWLNQTMHQWGYGAIFGGGIEIEIDPVEGSKDDFYEWLADNSPLFTVDETSNSGKEQAVKRVLNFNITNKETGLISMNRALSYPITVGQILWVTITDAVTLNPVTWLMAILGIVTALFSMYALGMILINYVMALVDFYALQGFGLIMIPLSLFNGTKSYLETLLGGVGKITVKLLIITAIVYINIASTLNIMVSIYESSGRFGEFFDLCISVLITSLFLYALSKEATTISGFLSGDMPRMSFGEFARAAQSAKATAGAAGAMGKAVAGAAGTAGAAGIAALAAAGSSAQGASAMGKSGAGAFGSSLASSLKSGASSFAGGAIAGVTGVASAVAKHSGAIMSGGGSPMSAESFSSESSRMPGGGEGGSAESSGKSNSFGQNISNALQGTEGAKGDMEKYAKEHQGSHSAKERMKGAAANYSAQRQGGASRKEAFRNSISDYAKTEQNRNPGTASFSKDELANQTSASTPPTAPKTGGESR